MNVLEKMSSLEIAERTGKEHKHVLRDIRTMIDQLGSPNLDSNQYQVVIGNNNKTYEILLDKELTLVLATGYNVPLRLKIIKRWQELEAVQDKPVMDELEMVIASAQHLMAVKKEQKEQAIRLNQLEKSNREILARQNAIVEGLKFFTVLGYANLNNLQHLILKDAQSIGKRAAHLSRERNIPIDKVRDPRFGQVNAYAETVLNEIVAEYLG